MVNLPGCATRVGHQGNILIHGYDLLDHAKVWQVIANDLSHLEAQVSQLLAEYTTKDDKAPPAASPEAP